MNLWVPSKYQGSHGPPRFWQQGSQAKMEGLGPKALGPRVPWECLVICGLECLQQNVIYIYIYIIYISSLKHTHKKQNKKTCQPIIVYKKKKNLGPNWDIHEDHIMSLQHFSQCGISPLLHCVQMVTIFVWGIAGSQALKYKNSKVKATMLGCCLRYHFQKSWQTIHVASDQ